MQRYPIIMTDADYDYILDEIERREKNEFERNVSGNNWMSLYCFFSWFLLQIFLGASCTYLIMITSRRG